MSAALCPSSSSLSMGKSLPKDSSVYIAEVMALNLIRSSALKSFIIFSDSLSALQAMATGKMGHPRLLDFSNHFNILRKKGKRIVLAWIPDHVGIYGSEAADGRVGQIFGF